MFFRIKTLWNYAPLPAQAKLVWTRLTCNKLVIFYLSFSLIHCALQVIFQFSAHTINFRAGDFLEQVVTAAGLNIKNFTLYHEQDSTLRSCWGIPKDKTDPKCLIVWRASPPAARVPSEIEDISATIASFTQSLTSLTSTSIPASTSTSALALTTSSSASRSLTTATTTRPTPSSTATPPREPEEIDDDGEDSDSDDDDERPSTRRGAAVVFETVTTIVSVVGAPTPTTRPTVPKRHVPVQMKKRNVFISPITARTPENPLNNTITGLRIGGLGDKGTASFEEHDAQAVEISLECAQVVRWPLQSLRNAKREDLVFVGFQLWVFGMGVVALLNESIPHIIASFLTHVLATIWSSFQLAHTARFQRQFVALTINGACKGVNLLPGYWKDRSAAEIPVMVLNCIALVVSAFLSWKLVKSFGWATFKRVGADLAINRLYKLVLSLAIGLQLSLFFIVTSVALWIDQLYNGSFGIFSVHGNTYRAIDILLFIALVPWLALGWFAVRKENKKMMYGFLGISVLIVVEWASMFASDSWRLTFVNWAFFAVMAVAAVVLTIIILVLGIVCLCNFGVGLAEYLKPLEDLRGEDFERIHDVQDLEDGASLTDEKVPFPTTTLPSYSATFPAPPPEVQAQPTRRESARSVVRPGSGDDTSYAPVVRQNSGRTQITLPSNPRATKLVRSNSQGSQRSSISEKSKSSQRSGGSDNSGSTRKRWVIE